MAFRSSHIASLSRAPLDLLIIGGGIVGAGIVRDAALRGLKVGLIEQNDFASGTSSRSSRLLHGGIRYLAQGRIGLVREASLEKTLLHKIAPHLADPLAFVFPSYTGEGWPLWQLKIGVRIYDLLCSGRNLGRSQGMEKGDVLRALPGLRDKGLRGAVRYYDGFTNDARLVIDTLRSAENSGALIANYIRYIDSERANDHWQCKALDTLTGAPVAIRARSVVNATGPWAAEIPRSSVKLRCTKGIHVVIERSRLHFDEAVVITAGKRILFVIPWGERAIIGTTDTDYNGRPEDVRVEENDIRYLLDAVNSFFPELHLRAEEVISSWAGLRPLIADPNGQPSDLSRSHEIANPEPGWWDVSGGKLTTYRLMAEQTVDKILASEKQSAGPCQTAVLPLLSAAPAQLVSGITPPPFTRENVEHFCNDEWVIHLDDLMLRRTSWAYYHRDSARLAEQSAEWMSATLGWSEEQRERELQRYHESF